MLSTSDACGAIARGPITVDVSDHDIFGKEAGRSLDGLRDPFPLGCRTLGACSGRGGRLTGSDFGCDAFLEVGPRVFPGDLGGDVEHLAAQVVPTPLEQVAEDRVHEVARQ